MYCTHYRVLPGYLENLHSKSSDVSGKYAIITTSCAPLQFDCFLFFFFFFYPELLFVCRLSKFVKIKRDVKSEVLAAACVCINCRALSSPFVSFKKMCVPVRQGRFVSSSAGVSRPKYLMTGNHSRTQTSLLHSIAKFWPAPYTSPSV